MVFIGFSKNKGVRNLYLSLMIAMGPFSAGLSGWAQGEPIESSGSTMLIGTLAQLTHSDRGVRQTALLSLGAQAAALRQESTRSDFERLKIVVVPAVIPLLVDVSPGVRMAAVGALGEMPDFSAIAPLGKLFNSATPFQRASRENPELYRAVKIRAATVLAKFGSEAVPALSEALKDEDEQVRSSATASLVELVNTHRINMLQPLTQAMNDPDPGVRRGAVVALGKIGVHALKTLKDSLKDQDIMVRQLIIQACARKEVMGTSGAIVLNEALKDSDKTNRFLAVLALGPFKDPASPQALVRALKDSEFMIREAAASTLCELGREAVPYLIDVLGNPGFGHRDRVALVLGQIRDLRALPALVVALNDPDLSVRLCAARSLGSLRSKQAVPALEKALKDPNAFVQEAAHQALERLGK